MRKKLTIIMALVLSLVSFAGCGGSKETAETEAPADQTEAVESPEGTDAGETTEAGDKDLPQITIVWGQDLHTANMQMVFEKPELFTDNEVYLQPTSESTLDLIKDGKPIANLNFIIGSSGSENVTMMLQNQIDIAYSSSTAFMTGIDQGLDCSILCPIQSGGVSVVADIDAPYDTFEELIEYAKGQEVPIKAGYHSAVSSPRIVLEYALTDAGLKVTEDTADFEADVVMTDLKGLNNLVPSLSSNQVELWAGPIPNPQNAEAQGVGKIIATLDELPGGKWVDFPCCTMNVRNELIREYPDVVQALVQVTADVHDFAQNNRVETAELLSDFVGLDREVMEKNDTTYITEPTENFKNGMRIYYEAMTQMGKFSGEFAGKEFDEVKDQVFDFSFIENVKK